MKYTPGAAERRGSRVGGVLTQAQDADAREAASRTNAQRLRQEAVALEPARNAVVQQADMALRWQQEIAREPMNRATAEVVALELWARRDALD